MARRCEREAKSGFTRQICSLAKRLIGIRDEGNKSLYKGMAQRRLIGSMVRGYREQAAFDLDDAAKFIGCDRSKMSRIETGERGLASSELRKLLTEYYVTTRQQDLLAALSGWREMPGWFAGFLSDLPSPYLDFVSMETFASKCLIYAPTQIPEPLCIEPYISALVAAAPSIPKDKEAQVVQATQARRRAVVGERRTGLFVVLGEAALRRQVGDAEVLRRQLAYLIELTGHDYSWINIRVLPFDAEPTAVGDGGAFAILRFEEIPDLSIMQLAGPAGGLCLYDQELATRYVKAFPSLTLHSLSATQSARRIALMASR